MSRSQLWRGVAFLILALAVIALIYLGVVLWLDSEIPTDHDQAFSG